MSITHSAEWSRLAAHAAQLGDTHIRELFAQNPRRGEELVVNVGDLRIDYSKHRATAETLALLQDLAAEAGVAARRDAMFSGQKINTTENRAVLHTALRAPKVASITVDGVDVVAQVHKVLDKMGAFTDSLRDGTWRGATGERITTVVNIGIGGSDLGPAMVDLALRRYANSALSARFVSNVDPSDLLANLNGLDPAKTLFVVASKTFTTLETLTNAQAARGWLFSELGVGMEAVAKHFVALSTNTKGVADFGIDPKNMFEFWDWVGGRYSVWSAIGLSVMAVIGKERFAEFLAGGRAVDEHFLNAPPEQNAPFVLGLLGLWYSNFHGAQSRAVLPYAQDLRRFPAYLQQLTMESNGKSTTLAGGRVASDTGEVFWGEPGTNGQHAFYQLLHQGTRLIQADFIAFAKPLEDLPSTLTASDGNRATVHDLLISNFLAQSKVLAFGKTLDEILAEGTAPELAPHKVMPGNRPSTSIFAPKLTPSTLGQLIALYEHQVFVEGAVWGVNSFDQWGVELGKAQAKALVEPIVASDPDPVDDSSTQALLDWYREQRR